MRKNHQEQQALLPGVIDHEHAKELEAISDLLDANPRISELATQDVVPEGVDPAKGRDGMTGDLAIRAAIVRQLNGFSYEELAFHLADSVTYQRFCRIGIGEDPPKKSTLAQNIKRIRPETWEAINRVVIGEATVRGVEKGNKARMDCTVVESLIHAPTDSSLLFDVVRVVARLLAEASEHCTVKFSNRTRRAKRRALDVLNAKNKGTRKRAYRDLLNVTRETLGFAGNAIPALRGHGALVSLSIARMLEHYAALGWKVVDQTHRRVFEDEVVPASEKIFSIFEEHTDIIIKDRRDTYYGHKVCLSTGSSSLILDLKVLDGNPADSTLVEMMLDRHIDIYGKAPRQAAFDGGFASRANVAAAKAKGVKDACFSKRRGIPILDMVKSTWVYKKLKRFRAGVEGCISFLKRSFGMDRCRWRSLASFKSYVWAAAVTCNLLILARHAIQ